MKRVNSSFTVMLIIIFSVGLIYAGENQISIKTFKVSKGGLLKISLSTGEIRINTWDKNEVSVKMEDIDDMDEMSAHQVKIKQSGNTIIVENRGGGGWPNSNDVSVTVPTEFNIDAQTRQGDVDLRSFIKGNVSLNSGGGDITVKDINGKVYLKTFGGDVTTGEITGDCSISTNGGDLSAGNIEGNADFYTMGGSIDLKNVSKDLKASTNGGEIYAGNVGGTVHASTMGGEIILKKVTRGVDVKTNGGNLKLAGSGGPVNAKTLGGNIDLYNVAGPVDASTNAGNINVELKSTGNSSSSISTMAGDIMLYIDPSEKVTIDAYAREGGYDSGDKAIYSEFPSKEYRTGKYSGRAEATYILNDGGNKITLKTHNGKIYIKKIKK